MPQIGWLKTTEMYSFTFLKVRSSKSRYGKIWLLLESVREDLSHVSLLVSGGCQHSMIFLGLQTRYSNFFLSHQMAFFFMSVSSVSLFL